MRKPSYLRLQKTSKETVEGQDNSEYSSLFRGYESNGISNCLYKSQNINSTV